MGKGSLFFLSLYVICSSSVAYFMCLLHHSGLGPSLLNNHRSWPSCFGRRYKSQSPQLKCTRHVMFSVCNITFICNPYSSRRKKKSLCLLSKVAPENWGPVECWRGVGYLVTGGRHCLTSPCPTLSYFNDPHFLGPITNPQHLLL